MAEDFIVKDVDVSEFSGESRFAGIYFAVNDDTYAQSPTDINEDDILFPFDTPLQILAVCHCAGVIIDTNLITDFSVNTSASGRSEKLNWLKLYPDSGLTRPDILMLIFSILSVLTFAFL